MVEPARYRLSLPELRATLRRYQVMTEAAKAPVPSLVASIVDQPWQGSWWALPRSSAIYNLLMRLREDDDVLLCRLVQKRLCYVHRDSWPALAALAGHLPAGALDRVVEEHLPDGRHRTSAVPLADWLPPPVQAAAQALGEAGAVRDLEARVPGLPRALRLSAAPSDAAPRGR